MTNEKDLIMLKLGGYCLSNSQIKKSVDIVAKLSKSFRLCVVVSSDPEETNRLRDSAIEITQKPDPREFDALLSTAETETAALFAIRLISMNCPARSINAFQLGLKTDSKHGKARIKDLNKRSLTQIKLSNYIYIVAGFQGLTEEKAVSTLGRGGGDITAVCLAAATKAKECVLFKRYPGLFDTDPILDPNTSQLKSLASDELVEMANFGMRAIQLRAAQFAFVNKVPLRITSTNDLRGGTRVVAIGKGDPTYKLVTSSDQSLVAINGVSNRPGSMASIYSSLLHESVYFTAVSQSMGYQNHARVDLVIPEEDIEIVALVLDRLAARSILKNFTFHNEIILCSLIGAQMENDVGIAARFVAVFEDLGINIKMVNTSTKRITVVLDQNQTKDKYQVFCNRLREKQILRR